MTRAGKEITTKLKVASWSTWLKYLVACRHFRHSSTWCLSMLFNILRTTLASEVAEIFWLRMADINARKVKSKTFEIAATFKNGGY